VVDIRPFICIPLKNVNINHYNNPYYSSNSYVTWWIPTIIAVDQHHKQASSTGVSWFSAVLLLWADHKAAKAAMDPSTL